jgi:hypothetical protein
MALVYKIIYLLSKIFIKILGKSSSPNLLHALINDIKFKDQLFTFNLRPKKIINHSRLFGSDFNKNVSIIIQGNLIFEEDFTLNTVKLYLSIYSEVDIILSTWDEYSETQLIPFKELGVSLILNKKPDYYGLANINLQMKSTVSGLDLALKKDKKYTIKSRTDQRFYGLNIIDGFICLLNSFPKSKENHSSSRIITTSLGSYATRMYSLSDMFQFGETLDLKEFWGADFQQKSQIDNYFTSKEKTYIESIEFLPEVYLITNFIKKCGVEINWSFDQSNKIIADYFLVVDRQFIDIFWNKYTLNERWKEYYNSIDELVEYTFRDWVINFTKKDLIN